MTRDQVERPTSEEKNRPVGDTSSGRTDHCEKSSLDCFYKVALEKVGRPVAPANQANRTYS